MTQRTFPLRLHDLLDQTCDSYCHDEARIISWTPPGNTFKIYDLEAFKTRILPKYFPKQSKYKSFRRQLQYYGFWSYKSNHFGHPCFVRKNKGLLVQVKHKISIKRTNSGSTMSAMQNNPRLAFPLLQTRLSATEPMARMHQPALSLDETLFKQLVAATEKIMQQQHPVLQQLFPHKTPLMAIQSNYQIAPVSSVTQLLSPLHGISALEQLALVRSNFSLLTNQQESLARQAYLALLKVAFNQGGASSVESSICL